jgi:hypothetical protein
VVSIYLPGYSSLEFDKANFFLADKPLVLVEDELIGRLALRLFTLLNGLGGSEDNEPHYIVPV